VALRLYPPQHLEKIFSTVIIIPKLTKNKSIITITGTIYNIKNPCKLLNSIRKIKNINYIRAKLTALVTNIIAGKHIFLGIYFSLYLHSVEKLSHFL
ncbi:hypothetical protein, partial [Yersinia aleksiciae]|uniref:hypothetical protein n=1 Tax=Yersinia aleksiciae TaxID=263819 RepID=UPI001C9692A8